MRAWSGPHKIARVLQEGRVYILDTGQKVPFERFKTHNSGPTERAPSAQISWIQNRNNP